MLTILAALKDEIRLIRSEMEVDKAIHIKPFVIYSGTYYGKKVTLIQTGVGSEKMNAAISYCIKKLKPSLLLNIGYAGGLNPQLHAGDIVIADKIIDKETAKDWPLDEKIVTKAISVCNQGELRFRRGAIVTVNKSLDDPHDKAFTGTRFEAVACDMESASFANIAAGSNIPFFVARSILDPLDTALPHIPEDSIIDGNIHVGKILNHLKSRPKDLFKLPKFSYLASQARIAITNFVKEWVKNEEIA